jgi:F-type H+-transporting ATPase subunit b
MMAPLLLLTAHTAAPHEAHAITWDAIVHSNIINVVLAAIFLFVVIRKIQVGNLLENRRTQIQTELDSAKALKEQTLAEVESLKAQAAQIQSELGKMTQEAEETATRVASQIVREAEHEAQKLLDAAQKRIEQESSQLARSVEKRLMQEALHGARQLLESTLSEADRKQSVEAFIE